MSVSAELLCSFELLKPLDSSALKSHIKKSRNKRQHMLNSPVCSFYDPKYFYRTLLTSIARFNPTSEHVVEYALQIRNNFFMPASSITRHSFTRMMASPRATRKMLSSFEQKETAKTYQLLNQGTKQGP
jgi:hypothetical protein